MDSHPRGERRRLSRVAVFQDRDRWNRPRARCDSGQRARRAPWLHGAARSTLACRPAHGWHLSRDAQGRSRLARAAGTLGYRQQHANPRQVRSRQRSPALAVQDAMTHRYARIGAVVAGTLGAALGLHAQTPAARGPAPSLVRPTSPSKAANADGFLQRWLLLEPIRVSGQLTDSAVRAAVAA